MTYEEIKKDEAIRTYIIRADESLSAIGLTEHSFAHLTIAAEKAGYIPEEPGYPARTAELARIAGYLHDIGNLVKSVIMQALEEITGMALTAFKKNDARLAMRVEPLEQIIDGLKERLRTNHIIRMQQGLCGIEAGFVWSDLLTNIERVSDHCSNIAGCVIDVNDGNLNLHASLREVKKKDTAFTEQLAAYAEKYGVLLQ